MQHDSRMTQSNWAASRQRVGSVGSSSNSRNSNEYDEHYRSYHHGYHYRSNGINGYSTNEHNNNNNNGRTSNNGPGGGVGGGSGGTVSALSGSENHESLKQWEWFEDVLAKSQRNGETVSFESFPFDLCSSEIEFYVAIQFQTGSRRMNHVQFDLHFGLRSLIHVVRQ